MTKRDAILKASDQLFSSHGYGLTGVDAIALAAGVTKRTLYKQFGSKEGLFVAWLRGRDLATRTALQKAVEAMTNDPAGQILALFSVLAAISARPDFHGCPFSRALIEFGTTKANNAGQVVAQEHKAQLALWFEDRLTASGALNVADLLEEIMLLYEGTLARTAMTHAPDAALAARALLELRFQQGSA
jgi:AcrR family transcriptional regulator